MGRSRALAGALALVALAGCGYSTGEIVKPRYPPGGADKGPDVQNRMVDKLRTVDISILSNRFVPRSTSVGLDSLVRLINKTNRPIKLRVINLVGHPFPHTTLAPGEVMEREYLHKGTEVLGIEGTGARLQIVVYSSA